MNFSLNPFYKLNNDTVGKPTVNCGIVETFLADSYRYSVKTVNAVDEMRFSLGRLGFYGPQNVKFNAATKGSVLEAVSAE
jgi:hypothetical protein